MKGVTIIKDETNNKRFAQIDLDEYAEIWEDIQDILSAESRKNEDKIPWEEVKAELNREGKL